MIFQKIEYIIFDLYKHYLMVTTTRNERSKPTTNWSERVKPTTDWNWRIRPINFFQPLEDAENIVCNEDSEIIYIYANVWEPISMTIWTPRA